jgi:hypothetical protein
MTFIEYKKALSKEYPKVNGHTTPLVMKGLTVLTG